MMIFLLCFILIFLILKEDRFLGPLFKIEESTSFIIVIFPLVFFLFHLLNLNFRDSSIESLHFRVLLLILISLSLRFISNFRISFLIFLETCVILMLLFIFRFSKDKDKVSSTIFIFIMNIAPSIIFIYFCCSDYKSLSSFLFSIERHSTKIFFLFFLGLLLSKLPLFLFHF